MIDTDIFLISKQQLLSCKIYKRHEICKSMIFIVFQILLIDGILGTNDLPRAAIQAVPNFNFVFTINYGSNSLKIPNNAEGDSSYGDSSYGAPNYGDSSYGDSSYGASSYGASSYGDSSYGASSYGDSSNGDSSYGKNTEMPAIDTNSDEAWRKYKETYKKVYSGDLDKTKKSIYDKAMEGIIKHNAEAAQGMHTYRRGVNEYTDMEHGEFMGFYTGYRTPNEGSNARRVAPAIDNDPNEIYWNDNGEVTSAKNQDHEEFLGYYTGYRTPNKGSNGRSWVRPANANVPNEKDWRDLGVVTSVKNQGQCGSCWAFAAIGSLESRHQILKNEQVDLSEQNLVDCVGEQDTCNGGWMQDAYNYIRNNGGIDNEQSYPYNARYSTCKFRSGAVAARCTGYIETPSGDENALKEAIATYGPVSVAFDADSMGFQSYKSGIYYNQECSSQELNHAFVVVGYGSEDGNDYWIIKNSWGTSWGENGFGRIARNKNNHCGIASSCSFPLLTNDILRN